MDPDIVIKEEVFDPMISVGTKIDPLDTSVWLESETVWDSERERDFSLEESGSTSSVVGEDGSTSVDVKLERLDIPTEDETEAAPRCKEEPVCVITVKNFQNLVERKIPTKEEVLDLPISTDAFPRPSVDSRDTRVSLKTETVWDSEGASEASVSTSSTVDEGRATTIHIKCEPLEIPMEDEMEAAPIFEEEPTDTTTATTLEDLVETKFQIGGVFIPFQAAGPSAERGVECDREVKTEEQGSCDSRDPFLDVGDFSICGSTFVDFYEAKSGRNKFYTCQICMLIFITEGDLISHGKTHTGENLVFCGACEAGFSDSSSLDLHKCTDTREVSLKFENKRSTHGKPVVHNRNPSREKPFTCDVCNKSFVTDGNLTAHVRIHSGERPFKCKVCEKACSTTSHLRQHSRSHDGGWPVKCEACEKSFLTRKSLTAHLRTHVVEKWFKCGVCEEKFSKKRHLARHHRTHAPARSYQCDVCEKSFPVKSCLTRHVRSHSGDRPFECEVCERRFSESSFLKNHKLIHAGEKRFKCEVCEKSFVNSKYLTTHLRIHSEVKPFVCEVCKKGFTRSGRLAAHKRSHAGDKRVKCEGKPFTCDVCKRSFRKQSHLTVHGHIHSGVRPFKCEVCGNGFSSQTDLTAHGRTHSDVRPFECDVCKRTFLKRSKLVVHSRTHTGDRPFVCEDCGKSFSFQSNLTVHARSHTGDRPFECEVCQKCFVQSCHLKKHKLIHSKGL